MKPEVKSDEIRSQLTQEMKDQIVHSLLSWEEIEKTEKIVQDLVKRSKTRQHK